MSGERNADFAKLLRQSVMPVVTVDDPEQAVALARALADGGLPVIEVTLRTASALACIKAIVAALPGRAVIGAGTVRTPADGAAAMAAGAAFLVSPGVTPNLIQAAQSWRKPFMPGVATASEAMALADMGYAFQKFFPAEQAGGAAALKALSAPLPDIRFCPTGGIHAGNAQDYLALPNVVCVGGSWVVPRAAVEARDWAAVSRWEEQAAALGGGA